jgi:hypothetical protein
MGIANLGLQLARELPGRRARLFRRNVREAEHIRIAHVEFLMAIQPEDPRLSL